MLRTVVVAGAVLAVALIAVGGWAWTPDRPRAELEKKYWDPATRYLEIRGTALRVRITGAPAAPAIVLLHGFGSSLETWEPWAQMLNGAYRVVRFDLPGCGLSAADGSGNYDEKRNLEILGALLDELHIDRAVLVGNSTGGRIAWRFAAEFPGRTRKLVLISPDGFASPGFEYGKSPHVPAVLTLMKYFLPRSLLRTNLAAAYGDPHRLSEATLDRYHELLRAPGDRAAMLDRMRQTVLEDPVPLLRRISAPTLLLWGEKDRLIPYANAADYLRELQDARLVSFTELGHVPHEESPAQSLQPVIQFLKSDAPAGSNDGALPDTA